MKILIPFFLSFFLVTNSGFSQVANFYALGTNAAVKDNIRAIGFGAGAIFTIPLSDKFDFKSKVGYHQYNTNTLLLDTEIENKSEQGHLSYGAYYHTKKDKEDFHWLIGAYWYGEVVFKEKVVSYSYNHNDAGFGLYLGGRMKYFTPFLQVQKGYLDSDRITYLAGISFGYRISVP